MSLRSPSIVVVDKTEPSSWYSRPWVWALIIFLVLVLVAPEAAKWSLLIILVILLFVMIFGGAKKNESYTSD